MSTQKTLAYIGIGLPPAIRQFVLYMASGNESVTSLVFSDTWAKHGTSCQAPKQSIFTRCLHGGCGSLLFFSTWEGSSAIMCTNWHTSVAQHILGRPRGRLPHNCTRSNEPSLKTHVRMKSPDGRSVTRFISNNCLHSKVFDSTAFLA